MPEFIELFRKFLWHKRCQINFESSYSKTQGERIMKRKILLLTVLATFLFGTSNLVFGKEMNPNQTNQTKSGTSKKQTDAEKKEAKEKQMADKKEAEKQRREAKMTAKSSSKTTKKKHKKFLGIF
jgi:hypothetical protein